MHASSAVETERIVKEAVAYLNGAEAKLKQHYGFESSAVGLQVGHDWVELSFSLPYANAVQLVECVHEIIDGLGEREVYVQIFSIEEGVICITIHDCPPIPEEESAETGEENTEADQPVLKEARGEGG